MFVKPADAATVVLLRPGRGSGIEVLMVLRHPDNRFVANCYVYPGGRIDTGDYGPALSARCRGITPEGALDLIKDMDPPQKALGAWVAGIREVFEEAGLLLACDAEGQPVSLEEPGKRERFGRYRRDLCHGAVTFADILEKEGLFPAADRLHYFSHWVTPEALPIRYDVRFFLALAPPDQEASHDGIELVEHRWIAPRRALDLYEAGRFAMVLPTLMTMAELARFDRVEDAIRFVPGNGVPRILTRMERRGGRFVEIMPDGTRHAILP